MIPDREVILFYYLDIEEKQHSFWGFGMFLMVNSFDTMYTTVYLM